MTVEGPKILFELFGTIPVTETTVNGWIIIALVFVLCKILTSKLEIIPTTKRQIIAEMIVTSVKNLVLNTMGSKCKAFIPYIITLFTYSVFGSLISLVGLRSVTADVNVILTWALITFILTQYNAIRTKRLGKYLKGFTEPIFIMTPMNIISELSNVISLTFRHFGNILAGFVITGLVYTGLEGLSALIGNLPFLGFLKEIPLFQVGIPAVLSLYFDLFSGFIQAFIFCTLSMVFISNAMDESACN